ncbi:hypothetical protein K2Q16_02995 [Patescibacteria group bacterium]|nr:hypothetical protein [Patescibacteria group bacterium]
MSERLTLLLATTYTVNDLHRRIALWRSIVEKVIYTEESVPEVGELKRVIAEQATGIDLELLLAWPEEMWRGLNSQSLIAEAAKLTAEAATVPVTVLYLPVSLEAKDVSELAQWCRTEYRIPLLDIRINPQVIGGCGVVLGNATYYEQSLHTLLSQRSGEITKIINSYV